MEELQRRLIPGWKTPNGWPAETASDAGGTIWTREVPGTAVALTVRDGEPRALLEYVIQRFSLDIHALTAADIRAFDAAERGEAPTGNHASGTAISLLPGHYPKGGKEMFEFEVTAVRDILKSCSGLVAWGGDRSSQSQGFFYLNVPPGSTDLAAWANRRDSAREQLGTPGILQAGF
ncbi:hypothetical protein SPF06_04820 [Sinomonas sp. JGH33]|uniref:Uncharacterized protein n=1 Tax=Sinomonas terricola TaxID=3110330 RepID=A0ABU5T4G6_9MICC|nr:hypothetical protein [Sinomonas sp. JGH33]MEA5454041.1 hypothetical protein [Sinomonas sp. JGH33]